MSKPTFQLNQAGSFVFDNAPIQGQSLFQLYDPLKQMAYQPNLRQKSILPYWDSGIEGLFSALTAALGGLPDSPSRINVKSRHFFWPEYDQFASFSFAIGKSGSPVGAGGASVTIPVSRLSLSQSGVYAPAVAGYEGYIKELGLQKVNITTVTKLSNGNFNIVLAPINGQVLNLTGRNTYTLIVSPMRFYNATTAASTIPKDGVAFNLPILRDAWIQKWERGMPIDESEIDNYIYDDEWRIEKGLNSRGEEVQYMYLPKLINQMSDFIIANRTIQTLIGQRDTTNGNGIDGVAPLVKKYGMFNFSYDTFMGASFKSWLFAIIKSLRKVNGSDENLLIYDFNFGVDWSEQIAAIVKAYDQQHTFSLFGHGGEGAMNFEHFKFKDFSWSNYHFRGMQLDVMDSYRYGHALDYTAFLFPAKAYTDIDGNRVPALSFAQLEGAEVAKDQAVWIDDGRVRGERNMTIYAKDNMGLQLAKLSQTGMISRGLQ